jgi:dTDP-4-dehydrorhamnose reductase
MIPQQWTPEELAEMQQRVQAKWERDGGNWHEQTSPKPKQVRQQTKPLNEQARCACCGEPLILVCGTTGCEESFRPAKQRRLTPKEVQTLLDLYHQGTSINALADRFGVTRGAIQNRVRGKERNYDQV